MSTKRILIPPSKQPVISLSGVSKSFGPRIAVNDISLEVYRGEVFGLIGQNGAGKTTLIRLVLGLLHPDSGAISVLGEDPGHGLMRRVGYLPEERGLYQRDRVRDVIAYFARLKGLSALEARKRSEFWIERFGLTSLARHHVRELSKGNQQRVQLATVLVSNPEVIILDEPLSGLDPLSRQLFIKTISDLAREDSRTFFVSTHAMDLVETLCDRVMMVVRGKRRLYGPLSELLRSSSRLLVRCSIDVCRLPMVSGGSETTAGTVVRLRPGYTQNDLLKAILEAGGVVSSLSSNADSLEDLFLKNASAESETWDAAL